MTTLTPALKYKRASTGWSLPLLWILATFAGAMLYFIPVGAVSIAMGLDRLEDPQRAAELTTGMRVLAIILAGAACGTTIGLAQWLVLRRLYDRMGHWITATIAAYAGLGLIAFAVSLSQSDWFDWAVTLIVNGKYHWLARVVTDNPDWAASAWAPGAITLILFGLVLGLAQWLVLRGRIYQAGWWIAVNVAGLALAVALSPTSWVVWATGFGPLLVAAFGLFWMQRRSASRLGAAS